MYLCITQMKYTYSTLIFVHYTNKIDMFLPQFYCNICQSKVPYGFPEINIEFDVQPHPHPPKEKKNLKNKREQQQKTQKANNNPPLKKKIAEKAS